MVRRIAFFSTLALMAWAACHQKNEPSTSTQKTDPWLNHGDSAQYVGKEVCQTCHAQIAETFQHTGMGSSFEPASRTKSAGDFSHPTQVRDSFRNLLYSPFWKGESMVIREFRLLGKDTLFRRDETVDFIVGSGQHTNSHLCMHNGYLTQMPLTFYTQKGKWDLPPGFENGNNSRFSRKIGLECMSCHNAYPAFVPGSENKYASLPKGIDCERCHGPGSIHASRKRKGEWIDTAAAVDYSIVNPAKLSIDRQFDVCQRCHLQGNTVLKEGKSFFDFKPGMRLADYLTVFLPRYSDSDQSFIMASHADRLKQSACFIQSNKSAHQANSLRPYRNGLTCVTCHNPHVSVKQTGVDHFNEACNRCHQKTPCSLSLDQRKPVKNSCISCHMPKSGSSDIPHVSVHDHWIKKPLPSKKLAKTMAFLALLPINEPQPDAWVRAEAYLNQFEKNGGQPILLDSAYDWLNKPLKCTTGKQAALWVRYFFLKKEWKELANWFEKAKKQGRFQWINGNIWSNELAWTAYRIGEAYWELGKPSEALPHLLNAKKWAPLIPDFGNKVGVCQLALSRLPDALATWMEVLKEDPEHVPSLSNVGFALMESGRLSEALEYLKKSLSLDPDHILSLSNAARCTLMKGDIRAARAYLKRIVALQPDHAQAKTALIELEGKTKIY
jgi:tetratricopeptide (TPR) repeat protein